MFRLRNKNDIILRTQDKTFEIHLFTKLIFKFMFFVDSLAGVVFSDFVLFFSLVFFFFDVNNRSIFG